MWTKSSTMLVLQYTWSRVRRSALGAMFPKTDTWPPREINSCTSTEANVYWTLTLYPWSALCLRPLILYCYYWRLLWFRCQRQTCMLAPLTSIDLDTDFCCLSWSYIIFNLNVHCVKQFITLCGRRNKRNNSSSRTWIISPVKEITNQIH